jgi:hypothetical protein
MFQDANVAGATMYRRSLGRLHLDQVDADQRHQDHHELRPHRPQRSLPDFGVPWYRQGNGRSPSWHPRQNWYGFVNRDFRPRGRISVR